jgi:hypothetical protein
MSLATMIAEQRGAVPGYSALLARTHLREAWRDIRNLRGWSFQLGTGGFSTPGLVSQGTVTVALGGNTVTGDAVASAVWATTSNPASLLTQRQFRVGQGTIYNIIAYNVVGGFGVLTLDRPYIDTSYGTGLGYSIYGCYYAVPVADFEAWESVLDVNNVIWLNVDPTRKGVEKINQADPQRQIFSNPISVIPHGTDQRPGSATFGYMVYELYPQPQDQYAYQTWFSRAGADLTLPTDTPPFPITEHLIKTKARVKAYEWLIVKLTAANPEHNTSGIQFSLGEAQAEYKAELAELRSMDRDRVDMWYSQMTRQVATGVVATFNPSTGMLNSRNL